MRLPGWPSRPRTSARPTTGGRRLARLALAIALGSTLSCASAVAPPPAPTTPRLVAIGDLHGDVEATLAALRLAGLVDAQGRWSGGDSVLIQTGDTTDRGPRSRGVLELLLALREEARAAGGEVRLLLGNHEAMNLQGDWRYVSAADIEEFGGLEARKAALLPDAPLGAFLRGADAVTTAQRTVFVHGGIRPRWAELGERGINEAVRAALAGRGSPAILGDDGPLWYRGLALAEEPLACAELAESLQKLDAVRMVVGHSTRRDGRIATRCGGQLLLIDTGISAHYGGHAAALELQQGDARALYPDGVVDLPDP